MRASVCVYSRECFHVCQSICVCVCARAHASKSVFLMWSLEQAYVCGCGCGEINNKESDIRGFFVFILIFLAIKAIVVEIDLVKVFFFNEFRFLCWCV